jgi:RNA polymerase sigma-70 factor (ECF subfamily)
MNNETLSDDKWLLAKVAKGDQFAFRSIYAKYSRRVFLFSMSILNSEELAEEVMQEVMLKIWLMSEKLRQIENLEAYLRTMTRNRSINVLSRLQLELKSSSELIDNWEETDNSTEEQILLRDTRKVLEAGVDALPPQQKLVFQLCRNEGLKYDEVAKQLGLSPATVQTHMKLALKFLRAHVSRHTDIAAILIIFKLF